MKPRNSIGFHTLKDLLELGKKITKKIDIQAKNIGDSVILLFIARRPLKGHVYLNKPEAFSCICV